MMPSMWLRPFFARFCRSFFSSSVPAFHEILQDVFDLVQMLFRMFPVHAPSIKTPRDLLHAERFAGVMKQIVGRRLTQ
jgi:hypothetical protein